MDIKIIGLGGIGSILCNQICRFVKYSNFRSTITLVDGDVYEIKNYERQNFTNLGNKALIKQMDLKKEFDRLTINSVESFVNQNNIGDIIYDNDVVFLGVDNHKTRMIVSNYCRTLENITLISGGNDYTDGNVQIYIRKEGKNLTPDLCSYHPEIKNPEDKLPSEMSCQELSKSEPQLLFTNLTAATYMCQAFYNVLNNNIKYSEVYFDIIDMKADSKTRKVKN